MDIAKDLAGLLLGAILSDTLKFRSPTTTAKDIGIAKTLADKAGLDIDVFAKEMFKVSSNISQKSVHAVSYTHLDVYKRQPLMCVMSMTLRWCIPECVTLNTKIGT